MIPQAKCLTSHFQHKEKEGDWGLLGACSMQPSRGSVQGLWFKLLLTQGEMCLGDREPWLVDKPEAWPPSRTSESPVLSVSPWRVSYQANFFGLSLLGVAEVFCLGLFTWPLLGSGCENVLQGSHV